MSQWPLPKRAGARMILDYTFGSARPSGGECRHPAREGADRADHGRDPCRGRTSGSLKVVVPARTRRMGSVVPARLSAEDPAFADWPKRFNDRGRVVAGHQPITGARPNIRRKPPQPGLVLSPWSDVQTSGMIDLASHVDLTDRMAADGTLRWSPPPGQWQVFVFKQICLEHGRHRRGRARATACPRSFRQVCLRCSCGRVGDPLVRAVGGAPTGLRATFVDSLELMQDLPWTKGSSPNFAGVAAMISRLICRFWSSRAGPRHQGEHFSLPYFEAGNSDDTGSRVAPTIA